MSSSREVSGFRNDIFGKINSWKMGASFCLSVTNVCENYDGKKTMEFDSNK